MSIFWPFRGAPENSRLLLRSVEARQLESAVYRLYLLRDRGSVCGTIVGGTHIGGHRTGGRAELRDGDLITVGASSSDYIFRFEIASIGPESFQ